MHADSKGKFALDAVTLTANRCRKCHGNITAHFHLIAHYVIVGNFSQEIIFCHTLRILA